MEHLSMVPHQFNPRVLFIMRRKLTAADNPESHSHDFITFIFIVSGKSRYEVGGKIYPATPGTLFIINPGVTHSRRLGNRQHLEELHFGVNNFNLKDLPPNYMLPVGESPVFSFRTHAQAFYNCCEEISTEQKKNDPGSPLMIKCLVMKLMVLILKERWSSLPQERTTAFMLERYEKKDIADAIAAYFRDHYAEPVTLARISESAYLSPIYVSRVFKEMMGESPIHYLIRIRLARACELLSRHETTIREVAQAVGYDDAYYFSRLFKKHYGVAPSDYAVLTIKPVFRLQHE